MIVSMLFIAPIKPVSSGDPQEAKSEGDVDDWQGRCLIALKYWRLFTFLCRILPPPRHVQFL